MTVASVSRGGLDYMPCRYGRSRMTFRGPKKSLEGDYIALIGGTETYGRFVPDPFCAQLERQTGRSCLNLGIANAGVDAFLNDPVIMGIACGATHSVVEVMGAQNMSNRFYTVHPRRNDRFVRASDALKTLYPEIDFTEHTFTRAMLRALLEAGADRFGRVVEELQTAWVARMTLMLRQLGDASILLWCGDTDPPHALDLQAGDLLGAEALFVTAGMIEAIRPRDGAILVFSRSDAARQAGTGGMVFSDLEAPAAAQMLGAQAHAEIAVRLAEALAQLPAGEA